MSPAACVFLSLLAFLSQRKLFKGFENKNGMSTEDVNTGAKWTAHFTNWQSKRNNKAECVTVTPFLYHLVQGTLQYTHVNRILLYARTSLIRFCSEHVALFL